MKKNEKLDLDHIAFIGRTYQEYKAIFQLNNDVMSSGPVLDCAAGPSSFTAEARERGFRVTACDVMYDTAPDKLRIKAEADIDLVFMKFDDVAHQYVWGFYRNKDDVIRYRKNALKKFIEYFEQGRSEYRYRYAELPALPFTDGQFLLVVSSHLLFLYGDRMDLDFHRDCLDEMVRVCSGEIRVYPLTGMDTKPYPFLDDVLKHLTAKGLRAEIITVPFEFLKGSNRMLRIRCEK
jgi:hypothetical protein